MNGNNSLITELQKAGRPGMKMNALDDFLFWMGTTRFVKWLLLGPRLGLTLRYLWYSEWWGNRPPMFGRKYREMHAALSERARLRIAEENRPLDAYPVELGAFRPESLN